MSDTWLEGYISIKAALDAASRPITVIYAQANKWRRNWRLRKLEETAASRRVPIEFVDGATIDAHAGGSSHGGLIAQVGARRFVSLTALVAEQKRPFVVMLDGIEDPYNFGQSVRALYAAGVHGVVVRPRNWLSAAGIVARASAGASERVPMAVAQTAEEAAAFFRRQGMSVACTGRETAVSIYEANLTQPMFLLLGGEKRGITRSFMRQADLQLTIPYQRPFDQSLGTATSTAVLAFERLRQLKTDSSYEQEQ